MILALDTSGSELLVALIDDRRLLEGRAVAGPRHQQRVIETVTAVAGGRLARLDAVAVVRGPGSHTGLRVGLSTASGLAFARRLPIHALSSLAVASQRAPDDAGAVLAIVAAGRGRVYTQEFASDGAQRRSCGERRLQELASLTPLSLGKIAIAGEPSVLAQLDIPSARGRRPGAEALTAAVNQAMTAQEGVNYDQLTGDYGEF